ncbi:hypothetical protein KBX18_11135 [Corynebacterium sp. CCUG 69979]|uniref:hypothetical protein n=1 Tax=Corynebacterium sp. CCUG 69979 TaxID=2823890 RepID=UPI00210BA8AD|nr:hypothetical protein [Corynebacterium sp. CCUG 69979]MCQ4626093.1 hypothetical protein [Corynebacterium sp. CCUG 69979]
MNSTQLAKTAPARNSIRTTIDYWSAPGCFLLDEGEVPPAKPEYTIGTVTTLAARTWDVHKGEIQISEGE